MKFLKKYMRKIKILWIKFMILIQDSEVRSAKSIAHKTRGINMGSEMRKFTHKHKVKARALRIKLSKLKLIT